VGAIIGVFIYMGGGWDGDNSKIITIKAFNYLLINEQLERVFGKQISVNNIGKVYYIN
jgi:hypothetical protein